MSMLNGDTNAATTERAKMRKMPRCPSAMYPSYVRDFSRCREVTVGVRGKSLACVQAFERGSGVKAGASWHRKARPTAGPCHENPAVGKTHFRGRPGRARARAESLHDALGPLRALLQLGLPLSLAEGCDTTLGLVSWPTLVSWRRYVWFRLAWFSSAWFGLVWFGLV